MEYKVKTLYPELFTETCIALRKKVEESGFRPEIAIAIPRAGIWMQEAAWQDFPLTPISLIRQPKGNLKKRLSFIIRSLPLAIRDRLRIWEAKRLIKRQTHMSNTGIVLPEMPQNVKNILLLDDAVDSGATLKAIVDKIRSTYPTADIRTAVITITSPDAVFMPDYYIYNDLTLIRTQWSIDMK